MKSAWISFYLCLGKFVGELTTYGTVVRLKIDEENEKRFQKKYN
jgi:hypothetical protein